MVRKKGVPPSVSNFVERITKEFNADMSKTSRCVYSDTIASVVMNTGVDKRTLSDTIASRVIGEVRQKRDSQKSRTAKRRPRLIWESYEERILEYLPRIPSFRHYGDNIRDGTAHIDLIRAALNYICYNGRDVRSKDAVESEYYKVKGRKRLRRKTINSQQRRNILRKKTHDEKLEHRLVKYLVKYPEFQYSDGEPRIGKLTEAVNYIFYDNRNVRTKHYVTKVFST